MVIIRLEPSLTVFLVHMSQLPVSPDFLSLCEIFNCIAITVHESARWVPFGYGSRLYEAKYTIFVSDTLKQNRVHNNEKNT